jgi:hypothetical protein
VISPERPLYLHFLAGELQSIIGAGLDEKSVRRAVQTLVVGTQVPLYCPISALWESQVVGSSTLEFVRSLIVSGALHTVGYTGTVDEFLESRVSLYRHDRDQYPAYFAGHRLRLLRALPTTDWKPADTTLVLVGALTDWATGVVPSGSHHPADLANDRRVRPVLLDAMDRRESQAITTPTSDRTFWPRTSLRRVPSNASER